MSDDAPPKPGLIHLGILYDTSDDLVTAVTPPTRRALDRGDSVCMMVDRYVVRRMRDELGELAGRIRFEAPTTLFRPSSRTFFEQLRAWGELGVGTLVVGQYTAFGVDESACASAEDCVNLLLADLPITLLCACARGAGPGLVRTVCRSHPQMVHDDVPVPNPDFALPVNCTYVPDRIVGQPALRMSFRDTSDLLRIREQVAGVAADVGLHGDDARAAVLAVHEAAVLSCPPSFLRDGAGRADPDVDRVLEVRASANSMSSEIRAPRSAIVPLNPDRAAEPAVLAGAEDPLRHIRWWCDDVTIHDSGEVRTIRVVTDPRRRLVSVR